MRRSRVLLVPETERVLRSRLRRPGPPPRRCGLRVSMCGCDQGHGHRTAEGRVIGVDLADGTGIDRPVVSQRRRRPWAPGSLAGRVQLQDPWTDHPPDQGPSDLSGLWPRTPFPARFRWSPTPPAGSTSAPRRADNRLLIGSIRHEDEQEVGTTPDVFNGNIDAAYRDVKIHALHHRIPYAAVPRHIAGVRHVR